MMLTKNIRILSLSFMEIRRARNLRLYALSDKVAILANIHNQIVEN